MKSTSKLSGAEATEARKALEGVQLHSNMLQGGVDMMGLNHDGTTGLNYKNPHREDADAAQARTERWGSAKGDGKGSQKGNTSDDPAPGEISDEVLKLNAAKLKDTGACADAANQALPLLVLASAKCVQWQRTKDAHAKSYKVPSYIYIYIPHIFGHTHI
jgi:hypothetical protein